MSSMLSTRFKVILLNFLSLFNRNKRTDAVLTSAPVITLIEPQAYEIQRESRMPAVGCLRDITMMLDQEAAELYGRSRYIK